VSPTASSPPGLLHPLQPTQALTADEVVNELTFNAWAPSNRPYSVLNMITTIDGRATLGGRAGPIGNEADRQLFDRMRTLTDAVMVGARTATVEGYHPLVSNPLRRQQREARGLTPSPLAILVSARLSVPPSLPLLQDPDSDVIIVTASSATLSGCHAHVEYIRVASAAASLRPVLRELRDSYGIRSVLCEGGPVLNAALLRDRLVDELFLSIAAKLSGEPDGLGIVAPLPRGDTTDLKLRWALQAEQDLFLRYAFPPAGTRDDATP
jgi:riboflavin-specific deaminase-like protein